MRRGTPSRDQLCCGHRQFRGTKSSDTGGKESCRGTEKKTYGLTTPRRGDDTRKLIERLIGSDAPLPPLKPDDRANAAHFPFTSRRIDEKTGAGTRVPPRIAFKTTTKSTPRRSFTRFVRGFAGILAGNRRGRIARNYRAGGAPVNLPSTFLVRRRRSCP